MATFSAALDGQESFGGYVSRSERCLRMFYFKLALRWKYWFEIDFIHDYYCSPTCKQCLCPFHGELWRLLKVAARRLAFSERLVHRKDPLARNLFGKRYSTWRAATFNNLQSSPWNGHKQTASHSLWMAALPNDHSLVLCVPNFFVFCLLLFIAAHCLVARQVLTQPSSQSPHCRIIYTKSNWHSSVT
jgi:hypothetical protein